MPGYRETALSKGMHYTVSDVPPPGLGILFGLQHFLVMMGATTLIPLITVYDMGGTSTDVAEVIATIWFMSGLNTLCQSTFGDRLPIIQGGSFAFLGPTFSIIYSPTTLAISARETCPPTNGTTLPRFIICRNADAARAEMMEA